MTYTRNLIIMSLLLLVNSLIAGIPGAAAQTPAKQPAPSAVKKASPTAAKKAAPRTIAVTMSADVNCQFEIDGKAAGELQNGESKKVSLTLKEHKIEAVSLADAQDRWQISIDLSKPGTNPAVQIELLPVQNKRLEEERKIAAARKLEEERRAAEAWIMAVMDGQMVPVKKLRRLEIEAGDRLNGITVMRNGTNPLLQSEAYYGKRPGSSAWSPAESFEIVEVSASGAREVGLQRGDRSYDVSYVKKTFSGAFVVLVPPELIPCKLQLR